MNKLCYSAVILDMDGLLLDTESTYFMAWHYALKQQNLVLNGGFYAQLSGCAFEVLEERLTTQFGDRFDFAAFCKLSSRFWYDYIAQHGIAVKQGAHELLAYLNMQAIPYCLASNSKAQNVQMCLQAAGLDDVFNTVICVDHVNAAKPAPDLFLKAAAVMACAIEQCLVIEDSIVGLMAAQRAGANSLFIPSMLPLDTDVTHYTTHVFDDLLCCQRYLAQSMTYSPAH